MVEVVGSRKRKVNMVDNKSEECKEGYKRVSQRIGGE